MLKTLTREQLINAIVNIREKKCIKKDCVDCEYEGFCGWSKADLDDYFTQIFCEAQTKIKPSEVTNENKNEFIDQEYRIIKGKLIEEGKKRLSSCFNCNPEDVEFKLHMLLHGVPDNTVFIYSDIIKSITGVHETKTKKYIKNQLEEKWKSTNNQKK